MSAFQLHPEHIAAMVGTHIGANQFLASDEPAVLNMAKLLAAENVRSLRHRYPKDSYEAEEGTPDAAAIARWREAPLSPGAMLKALACFDYQSCETDDYRQTPAAALVERMRTDAINKCPGFEEAEWAISEPPGTSKREELMGQANLLEADRGDK